MDTTQGKCRTGCSSQYSDETVSYDRGIRVRIPVEAEIFSLTASSRPFLGTNQPLTGTRPLSRRAERLGHGTNHSSPSGAGGLGLQLYKNAKVHSAILCNLLTGFTKMELLHRIQVAWYFYDKTYDAPSIVTGFEETINTEF